MQDIEKKLPSWLFVSAQMVLLGLLIFGNFHSAFDIERFVLFGVICEGLGVVGIIISALSLRKSLTAMPIPKAGGELSTGGLYRYVRHPMYTSVLLLAFGIAFQSGHFFRYAVAVLLTILLYFKSSYEEKFLVQMYSDYTHYSAQTPRFIPFRIRRV